ncbi:MAG: response regulator [Cyclobacteriaceae bacterium]
MATANNGVKALELIESDIRPDLVLADLMMPEMDGYELFDKIKENKELADTTFIMLTARASEDDKVQGIRYGVNDYLVKPFSSRELLSLIDSRIRATSWNLF